MIVTCAVLISLFVGVPKVSTSYSSSLAKGRNAGEMRKEVKTVSSEEVEWGGGRPKAKVEMGEVTFDEEGWATISQPGMGGRIEKEGRPGMGGRVQPQVSTTDQDEKDETEIEMPSSYKKTLDKAMTELNKTENVEEVLQEEALVSKAGVDNQEFRWTSYSMKIQFDPAFPRDKRKEVESAIYTLKKAMKCFRFIIVPSHKLLPPWQDHLYIKWRPTLTSCQASLGRYHGEKMEMTITHACAKLYGTSLHELMHVLGFFHEHIRPDRDNYLTVDWKKVPPQQKRTYEIRKHQKTFVSEYDFDSILQYRLSSILQLKPKVKLPKWVKLIGQRSYLSGGDKERLKKMYPCDKAPIPPTSKPALPKPSAIKKVEKAAPVVPEGKTIPKINPIKEKPAPKGIAVSKVTAPKVTAPKITAPKGKTVSKVNVPKVSAPKGTAALKANVTKAKLGK